MEDKGEWEVGREQGQVRTRREEEGRTREKDCISPGCSNKTAFCINDYFPFRIIDYFSLISHCG
jgi:hypothetical protein